MALRPSGRRVAAANLLFAAALVSSSCSAAPQEPAATLDPLTPQVASLTESLECANTYPLFDDVYHEASMRGEICMGSDGAITQLRVYSSDLAARAALQDWSLDAASQWLLLGNSWFAIGPRAQIDSVSESSGQELIPTQTLPLLPPDFKPNPIDDCVQFVSSTANTFLTDRSSFDTDRASLDQVVPGVTSMIEILLRDPDTVTLRSLSPDDLSFESEFSRLGPAIKTFCRDEQSDTE